MHRRSFQFLLDSYIIPISDESMVSLVLRQYMRGENGTESLVGFFSCLAYSNRKTKCQNYRKISRN